MIPAKLKTPIMDRIRAGEVVVYVPGRKDFGTHPSAFLVALCDLIGTPQASDLVEQSVFIDKKFNKEFGCTEQVYRNDADSVTFIILRK